jgi:hypothetical protein
MPRNGRVDIILNAGPNSAWQSRYAAAGNKEINDQFIPRRNKREKRARHNTRPDRWQHDAAHGQHHIRTQTSSRLFKTQVKISQGSRHRDHHVGYAFHGMRNDQAGIGVGEVDLDQRLIET